MWSWSHRRHQSDFEGSAPSGTRGLSRVSPPPCFPAEGEVKGTVLGISAPFLKPLKSRGLYLVYFSLIEKPNELPRAPSYYRALNYSTSSGSRSHKKTQREKVRETEKAGFDLFLSLFWDFQEGTDVYYFFKPVFIFGRIFCCSGSCLFSSAVCLNSTY